MNNQHLIINTDGGARGNPGPAAGAFVVKNDAGVLLEKCGKYLGTATNNVAEYSAVLEALKWVKDRGSRLADQQASKVSFFLDSNLVVQQLEGLFKVKNENLRQYFIKVKQLEEELSSIKINYSYVPREKNWEADKLVNETLDNI